MFSYSTKPAAFWAIRGKWCLFTNPVFTSAQCSISIPRRSLQQLTNRIPTRNLSLKSISSVQRYPTSCHSSVYEYSTDLLPKNGASLRIKRLSYVNYACLRHCSSNTKAEENSDTLNIKKLYFPTAKKVKRKILKQEDKGNIVGYGVADKLNLNSLRQDIESNNLYSVLPMPDDAKDVLAVTAIYTPNEEERHIFFFREGGVVFWQMAEIERMNELKNLKEHKRKSYAEDVMIDESDTLSFTYSQGATKYDGCDILLHTPQTEEERLASLLEKYTISKSLVLSVKLSCIERFVEEIAESMESITESMAEGKVKIKKQDLLRKIAEIIQHKHFVNCTSDLLDIPDFYWDRESLETLYIQGSSEFDLSKRVQVLSKRLEHCGDLLENIKAQATDAVHLNVEYLIVILIAVEVLLELFGRSIKTYSNQQYLRFKTFIASNLKGSTEKERALMELDDIRTMNTANRKQIIAINSKESS